VSRRIRDCHARRLRGKTAEEVIAFYRAAGQTAVEDAHRAKAAGVVPADHLKDS